MFDWLFKSAPAINNHFKEVVVTSSRYGKRSYKVFADSEICAIDALRSVSDQLPPLEAGEDREITTQLMP